MAKKTQRVTLELVGATLDRHVGVFDRFDERFDASTSTLMRSSGV